LPFKGLMLREY